MKSVTSFCLLINDLKFQDIENQVRERDAEIRHAALTEAAEVVGLRILSGHAPTYAEEVRRIAFKEVVKAILSLRDTKV